VTGATVSPDRRRHRLPGIRAVKEMAR
jgi:hypothetical protein